MVSFGSGPGFTRRRFIQGATAMAVLAACGREADEATPSPRDVAEEAGAPTETTLREPGSKLAGGLSILLWSHFVPSHDTWFDPFAKDWGAKVGVNVTVDHINNAEIPGRVAAEIAAGAGHDLIQYIAPLAQFEPSVLDLKDVTQEAEKRHGKQLEICKKTSFNPKTGAYYAYSPGWVPDPGDYRKSLWEQVGMPEGPSTWDELLAGGTEIKNKLGIQMGIGMSQEIDSNMAARALIWSYGGSIQDKNENVVLNSPETIDAVEFMTKLFKQTMTDEVFAWNAASNNQGLIAGQLSYILNSISAWRSAQNDNPAVADDVFFVPALKGPATALAAQHVLYNWIVPKHAANPDAAKEFRLHYTDNMAHATYNSKLYDFPAFVDTVPQLDAWLADDPFSTTNKDKLKALSIDNALKWSTNIGHPGP
ncbi:MAG TPA: extracellular solute-binding protein, partial [Acidimicrobiales bacterium]|nr:extracellular solute-binding protein [Acidimicrobiales bacterium]